MESRRTLGHANTQNLLETLGHDLASCQAFILCCTADSKAFDATEQNIGIPFIWP